MVLIEVFVVYLTVEVLSLATTNSCSSTKLSVEYPILGKKGAGCIIPKDPPETLPGAAE